jgi:periplasmic copper chaperone A
MQRISAFAAALTIGALFSGAALAAPAVTAAWSRPTVAGGTGAGFMTLANPDRKADALVRVESPNAARVEIHRSSMTGGVASMQMLPRLELPAGAKVVFGPGGHHLMFVGLKAPLKIGDTLPATLIFASGAKVKVTFQVTLAPPSDMGAHGHH